MNQLVSQNGATGSRQIAGSDSTLRHHCTGKGKAIPIYTMAQAWSKNLGRDLGRFAFAFLIKKCIAAAADRMERYRAHSARSAFATSSGVGLMCKT
jgi:hypothetical protein